MTSEADHRSQRRPSRRDIYDGSISGAQSRPFIPRLRSDPPPFHPLPHNLVEFRELEGQDGREHRLREVWLKLPKRSAHSVDDDEIVKRHPVKRDGALTRESAQELEDMYEDELAGKCGGHTSGFGRRGIGWREFKEYATHKEAGTCQNVILDGLVHSWSFEQSYGEYSTTSLMWMGTDTWTRTSLQSLSIRLVRTSAVCSTSTSLIVY